MDLEKLLLKDKYLLEPETAIVETVKQSKTWEDYVAVGLEARLYKDRSSWVLGDLSNLICNVSWGGEVDRQNTISKYAKDIGMNVKTLQEYSRVARIFKPIDRVEMLSFRHHQLVSKTKDPIKWLNKAADNSWTCEQLMLKLLESNEKPEKKEKSEIKEELDVKEISEFILLRKEEAQKPGTITIVISEGDDLDLEELRSNTTIGYIIKRLKGEI